MKLSDLVLNSQGKLSHTKVWTNIAYLAATVKFIRDDVPADIWLIYLGVVGAHGAASKFISLRYGGKDADKSAD